MKKKYILLSIMFIITVLFGINLICVKADSGWDSDYDFGGSWDSGSSWDSSSSWDSDNSWSSSSSGNHNYSHSSGSNDDDLFGLFELIIIVIIVIAIIKYSKKGATTNINYETISEEIIKQSLPDFNLQGFLDKSYNNFINVQNAWSNFDYDNLKKYLSDELFNTYKSQLKTLSIKKQKNIMSDFKKEFIGVTGFEYKDGKATIKVKLNVSFYDYVVDKNDKVVRGNKKQLMRNSYELTFISSKVNNKKNICPNCNAPLDEGPTNICPYCKSKIVHDNYDWILSKKEMKGRF